MASAAHRIATLVIGPQAGGRGYRVLARSDGPAISAAAESRLSELALVLAGWADEREPPAAALIPLTDATAPAVLVRTAYLGSAQLGTIAFAHALLLDGAAFAACGGRPETLLSLIPVPDGTRDFADAPRILPDVPAIAPPRRDWDGLGLEWRDRLLIVGDEAETEPTLRSVLAALGPATPGARVRGWATTALLPTAGAFDPARELQLLVVDAARRLPAGLHHLPARATATGFEGERVGLSPAARAFERVKALGALDADLAEAVAPLRWSPAAADQPPADLLRSAADSIVRRLSGGSAQMRLVTELARPRGDDLDPAFAQVARGLFAQLVGRDSLEPQHAAFYIKALADAPPAAAAAMAPLGDLLLRPRIGRWLRGGAFDRLMRLGWAEALADRADDAPAFLDGLGAVELAALLDHIMLSHDGRLRAPVLVSTALRLLADRQAEAEPQDADPEWASVYGAALSWRLGEAAADDERRLGCRSVVHATHRFARPLMPRLAERSLHLRAARDRDARERLDLLGGALAWVRLEGASA